MDSEVVQNESFAMEQRGAPSWVPQHLLWLSRPTGAVPTHNTSCGYPDPQELSDLWDHAVIAYAIPPTTPISAKIPARQ